MNNQKNLIIITGPSGVGKGTVVKEVLKKNNKFWLSVSATTRDPRQDEKEGENYFFLKKPKFEEMIDKQLFLEWAEFAGNYYGTPKESVNKKIKQGYKVILEIEIEGAKQVRSKMKNVLSIFLLPPNEKELERRIRERATESESSIIERLKRSHYEIDSSKDFDFHVVNNDLQKTIQDVFDIIKN